MKPDRLTKDDYVRFFNTPAGRKIIDDLEDRYVITPLSYTKNDPQPWQTFFNEGQRSMVRWLVKMSQPEETK